MVAAFPPERGTDGIYLTIDRWTSEESYRTFKEGEATRYAELDAECEALPIEETPIGAVEACPPGAAERGILVGPWDDLRRSRGL